VAGLACLAKLGPLTAPDGGRRAGHGVVDPACSLVLDLHHRNLDVLGRSAARDGANPGVGDEVQLAPGGDANADGTVGFRVDLARVVLDLERDRELLEVLDCRSTSNTLSLGFDFFFWGVHDVLQKSLFLRSFQHT
jgi:hypothetical protein